MTGTVFHIHLACTAAMTGIIWYVQWVHYPGFASVDQNHWPAFHRRHTGMTGAIVAPLMIGEAITGLILLALHPAWVAGWISLGLLTVVWLTTFMQMVPLHHRLEKNPNASLIRRLIEANRVRTAAWSGRFLLLLAAPP